jgi:hypothetical protein
MGGGLGFSEEELQGIFGGLFVFLERRRMRKVTEDEKSVGEEFLWAVLMQARKDA